MLDFADHAYVIETGRLVLDGPAEQIREDEGVRHSYPGDGVMERFVQLVIDGIAIRLDLRRLALALVLIFRSTGIVNFAQGEMAMFSTFIAWGLVEGRGAARARADLDPRPLVPRRDGDRAGADPAGRAPRPRSILIVTLGLFILINSAAGLDLGGSRTAPSAARCPTTRPTSPGSPSPRVDLGIIGVVAVVIGLLVPAVPAHQARPGHAGGGREPGLEPAVGISVGRTLMIGWGLAATLGALAGVLVAPQLFLDVNFMGGVLVYAFAAATLGGFDSPKGAVIGGWIMGVAETLAGDYIGFIGSDLTILVPLAIIFVVLLVRPNGLFGSPGGVRA